MQVPPAIVGLPLPSWLLTPRASPRRSGKGPRSNTGKQSCIAVKQQCRQGSISSEQGLPMAPTTHQPILGKDCRVPWPKPTTQPPPTHSSSAGSPLKPAAPPPSAKPLVSVEDLLDTLADLQQQLAESEEREAGLASQLVASRALRTAVASATAQVRGHRCTYERRCRMLVPAVRTCAFTGCMWLHVHVPCQSACTTHSRSLLNVSWNTYYWLWWHVASTQETSSQLQLGGDTLSEQQHRLDEAITRVRSSVL